MVLAKHGSREMAYGESGVSVGGDWQTTVLERSADNHLTLEHDLFYYLSIASRYKNNLSRLASKYE